MKKILRSAAVVAATVGLFGILFTGLAPVPSARAATSGRYVALGDSYSAGVGTGDRQDSCYRSPYGYPALVAGRYALSLNYQACQGAITADVRTNQVPALSTATTAVSMTIGGNDAGFSDVITECALPSWVSNCAGEVSQGLAVVTDKLPGRYNTLFATIKAKAPHARVAIGDYPLIFQGEDCNAGTFFSPDDEARINSATGTLDNLIRSKSAAYGFGFVEARPAFTGHAVCDDVEWINGLSYPLTESYHPNRYGNAGYAALFGPALTGRPYPTTGLQPTVLSRRSRLSRPGLSWQDRADSVLAMRLDSPADLARASRHGIRPSRILKLTGMLRTGDPAKIRSALAALQRLDQQTR